jgi:hypothetical protein
VGYYIKCKTKQMPTRRRNSTISEEMEPKRARMDCEDVQPISRFDNEITCIKSCCEYATRDIAGLNTIRLERKQALFLEEIKEHIEMCENALSRIPWPHVQEACAAKLALHKADGVRIEKTFERVIQRSRVQSMMYVIYFWVSIVFFCFLLLKGWF